jgi:hypothetical protein
VTTLQWSGYVSNGGILFTRHTFTSREGNPFTHPNAPDAFRFSERATEGYPAMYWQVPRGTGLTFKEGGRGTLGNSAWRWWTLDWTDGVEHEHGFHLYIVIPLTYPAVLFTILPIARIVSHFVRDSPRKRRSLGLCERCGYDLTGNTSGACPECGAACKAADPAGVSPAAGN